MKHLTLLLALFAFLAAGCAGETEVETTEAVTLEEDTLEAEPQDDLEAAMDSLGAAVEEVQEAAGDVQEAAEEAAEEATHDADEGH